MKRYLAVIALAMTACGADDSKDEPKPEPKAAEVARVRSTKPGRMFCSPKGSKNFAYALVSEKAEKDTAETEKERREGCSILSKSDCDCTFVEAQAMPKSFVSDGSVELFLEGNDQAGKHALCRSSEVEYFHNFLTSESRESLQSACFDSTKAACECISVKKFL